MQVVQWLCPLISNKDPSWLNHLIGRPNDILSPMKEYKYFKQQQSFPRLAGGRGCRGLSKHGSRLAQKPLLRLSFQEI